MAAIAAPSAPAAAAAAAAPASGSPKGRGKSSKARGNVHVCMRFRPQNAMETAHKGKPW